MMNMQNYRVINNTLIDLRDVDYISDMVPNMSLVHFKSGNTLLIE